VGREAMCAAGTTIPAADEAAGGVDAAPGSRRSRRRSRGQAMVEFGLIAPLFFLLLFAVVEFSLITASMGAMSFAAKDGARTGSVLGRTDPNVDQEIVADIRQRTAGIVVAKVNTIEIFKADASGNPVLVNGAMVENVYLADGTVVSSGWPVATRNDTLAVADYLGVRITYTYTYLTAFVSGGMSSLTLTATSIQRIEPADYLGVTG